MYTPPFTQHHTGAELRLSITGCVLELPVYTINLNQSYSVYRPSAFKTASVLQGRLAHSVLRNVDCSKCITVLLLDMGCLIHFFFFFHAIPNRLNDFENSAVWGPYHLFQDCLFFCTIILIKSLINVHYERNSA